MPSCICQTYNNLCANTVSHPTPLFISQLRHKSMHNNFPGAHFLSHLKTCTRGILRLLRNTEQSQLDPDLFTIQCMVHKCDLILEQANIHEISFCLYFHRWRLSVNTETFSDIKAGNRNHCMLTIDKMIKKILLGSVNWHLFCVCFCVSMFRTEKLKQNKTPASQKGPLSVVTCNVPFPFLPAAFQCQPVINQSSKESETIIIIFVTHLKVKDRAILQTTNIGICLCWK